jgi:hypothetical protein
MKKGQSPCRVGLTRGRDKHDACQWMVRCSRSGFYVQAPGSPSHAFVPIVYLVSEAVSH